MKLMLTLHPFSVNDDGKNKADEQDRSAGLLVSISDFCKTDEHQEQPNGKHDCDNDGVKSGGTRQAHGAGSSSVKDNHARIYLQTVNKEKSEQV